MTVRKNISFRIWTGYGLNISKDLYIQATLIQCDPAPPPPVGMGGGARDRGVESRQLRFPRRESQLTAATVALWMPHR
jgi:hypothetical protein